MGRDAACPSRTKASLSEYFNVAALCSTHACALGCEGILSKRLNAMARCVALIGIGEAIDTIETSKETWFEAEANRIAGEIALKSPKPDVTKAQEYFERALAVSRKQETKSWELRASMSLARLWRDQGKVQQAHELLAPVYGWFKEGVDFRDLKEAKALLNELQ